MMNPLRSGDRLLDAVRKQNKPLLFQLLAERPHQAEVREALEYTVVKTPLPEFTHILASEESIYRSGDVLAGLLQKGIKHGSSRCSGQDLLIQVLNILLEKGADLKYQDGQGRTPLHTAALHVFPRAVQLLMRHGASTDARDGRDQTPLMLAVQKCQSRGSAIGFVVGDHETDLFNRLSTVMLLQTKCDVHKRDRSGKTAASIAEENGYPQVAGLLNTQTQGLAAADGSRRRVKELETVVTLMRKKLKSKEHMITGLQEQVVCLERSLAAVEQETEDMRIGMRMRRAMSESGVAVYKRFRQLGKTIQSRLSSSHEQPQTEASDKQTIQSRLSSSHEQPKPEASDNQTTDDSVFVDEHIEPGIIMKTSTGDLDVLHLIARELPRQSMYFVGRQLGLTNRELENIEYSHKDKGLPEVCYRILLAWKTKAAWAKHPMDHLLHALTQEHLADLAEKVASMSLADKDNFTAT